MATYVTLIRFTEQGARQIQGTGKRAADFTAKAREMGVTVRDMYWLTGAADGVLIFEAADDETAVGATAWLSSQGYVRTETSRAFDASEIERILQKWPQ